MLQLLLLGPRMRASAAHMHTRCDDVRLAAAALLVPCQFSHPSPAAPRLATRCRWAACGCAAQASLERMRLGAMQARHSYANEAAAHAHVHAHDSGARGRACFRVRAASLPR